VRTSQSSVYRVFAIFSVVLGALISIHMLLQVAGVIPGNPIKQWYGPVMLLSGSSLLLRRHRR
jgi:hypothetical protein